MGFFSKFFLFVLNFIVFALGVAVIALASIILAKGDQFEVLLESGTFTVPVILLVLGIFVMLLGFFGCFGALKESKCLLYTYAAVVMVLLLGQIGVAVYGFINQDELMKFVSDAMTEVFNKYGNPSDTDMTKALDGVQHEMHCCGVYNYTDWFNKTIMGQAQLPAGSVPVGCCRSDTDHCNENIDGNPDAASIIYTEGCYTKLIDLIQGNALWLGIGAIVLGLVQLACIVVACGLGNRAGARIY